MHPGGPFHARRDAGAWTIPKGEIDDGEDPLGAALREFHEETGFDLARDGVLRDATTACTDVDAADHRFVRLDPVRQRSGKIVLAWAAEGDLDATRIVSNTFELEWPPRSGVVGTYPEVDRAAWFPIAQARRRILKGQQALLDQFTSRIA